jgi:hypothetical protein
MRAYLENLIKNAQTGDEKNYQGLKRAVELLAKEV